MELLDLTCSHCGAPMKLNMESSRAECEHCGATVLIREMRHVLLQDPEKTGYEFEKGRQRAQREAAKSIGYHAQPLRAAAAPARKPSAVSSSESQEKEEDTSEKKKKELEACRVLYKITEDCYYKALRSAVLLATIILLLIVFIICTLNHYKENVKDIPPLLYILLFLSTIATPFLIAVLHVCWTTGVRPQRELRDKMKHSYELSLKEEELEAKKKEGTADEITGTNGNADTTEP